MTITLSATYQRNIEALRSRDVDLAADVDAAVVPEGTVAAVGRDDAPTLRLPDANGTTRWFGRSSMPSISADAVVGWPQSDGGSMTIPGILTGVEPLLLAERLPRHTAVFVVEPDPLNIKLAFHLHDYCEPIASGRVVLIDGRDPIRAFRSFFGVFFGCEFPRRLLPVPQRSTIEFAETQRRVEQAAGEVGRVCADVVDRLTSEIKRRSFDVLPESPRVAVLSVDVAAESLAQAGRIARALEALGWPHVCCLPDRPNHCHTAARLSAINEIEADLVLLVNSAAGALAELLPAEMPVASWYLPGATIGADLASRMGAGHVVFAASPEAFDALLGVGVADDALHRLDLAGDDTVFAPADLVSAERRRLGCDIAIVSDVPDDRANALNISLASQITLCEAVRTIVAKRADEYTASTASEMLESAERACRTELQEATLREWFLNLIRTIIAPAAIARKTAATILGLGVPLGIWGRNWHGLNADTDPRRGMIPDDAELNRIYTAARVVLFPLATPRAIQSAVDARLSGAEVVCREPDAGFAQSYPGLAESAGAIHFYRDMGGLTRIITTVLAGAKQDAPKTRVVPPALAGHTTAARLRELVAVMRTRATPKTASGT